MATASQNLDVARLLARQKRSEARSDVLPADTYQSPTVTAGGDLPYSPKRESVFSRLLRNAKQESEQGISGGIKKTAEKPLRLASARALQAAWFAVNPLSGAASLGISTLAGLAYLNFHLMMRAVAPDAFARFGTEWTSEAPVFKQLGSVLGIVEIILIILLDVAVIMITIGIVAVLLILFDYLSGLELIPDIGWTIIEWFPNILNYLL